VEIAHLHSLANVRQDFVQRRRKCRPGKSVRGSQ